MTITRTHGWDGKYRLDTAAWRLTFLGRRTDGLAEKAGTSCFMNSLNRSATRSSRVPRRRSPARAAPRPTEAELTHGIPLFFGQLIETLKGTTPPNRGMDNDRDETRPLHARLGFSVGQVVYDYGDLCQAVTELAFELNAKISVDEFQTLNRCLDDAIAQAVTEYGRMREQALTDQGVERSGPSRTSCATTSTPRCWPSVFSKAEPWPSAAVPGLSSIAA